MKNLPKAEDLGIFNGGKSYFPQYLLRVNDLTFCHSGQDRWTHRHSKAKQHAFNNDAVICEWKKLKFSENILDSFHISSKCGYIQSL